MSEQLSIDFTPNKYAGYGSTREFINDHCIPSLIMSSESKYTHKKQIAADCDLSPSLMAKKLSDYEKNTYGIDDLETYIEETKDVEPIKYLAWKYLSNHESEKDKEIRELKEKLARIERDQ